MATQTRNPNSDVSFTGSWTGSAGTRFQSVDDYPDSGNPITDGLTHGTSAGEGLFGFIAFSIPAGSTGISVQVLYYDFKNAAQSCNIRARLRCGDSTGRDAPGGTHNPGNGNGNITQRTDDYGATNPKSGSAWTVNDINGVGANALTAFGTISTDANPTITVSSIQLQITYAPPVTGDLSASDAPDVAAASAATGWIGTLATTEDVDTAASDGTVQWIASMAATEAPDAIASTGTVGTEEISGDCGVTESPDSPSVAGTAGWAASLVMAEAPDAIFLQGFIPAQGDLQVTEEADSISIAGELEVSGILGDFTLVEPADSAVLAAVCEWNAVFAGHEHPDTVSMVGVLPVKGNFAVHEEPDFVLFGQIRRTRSIKHPYLGILCPHGLE